MTFGTAENIFSGGLLTDAERDFVMRDSNAFLFGLIADQSVKAETAWSLPYKLAQRLGHFSMQKIAKESSSEVASAIGLIGGMIIYFFIFMYASQVMKGVIEEKTNRIIEVLVSSVKPFQFLLGKIIGVAAVGLLIWVVFGLVLILVMQTFFLPGIDLEALRNAGNLAGGLPDIAGTGNLSAEKMQIIQKVAMTIDPIFIIKFLASFLFYFIGGYLLYASLFAAIGAAVDNETDSQQFLTPLSIILVIGLYIGEKSRIPDGILEFVDPVHLTDRYAGPYPLRSTDLGNPDLYGIINRQFYLFYLAIRKNLPHRYFNVWQKSHLERTLQMAEILTSPGIPGRTFRPILSKLSFHLLLK